MYYKLVNYKMQESVEFKPGWFETKLDAVRSCHEQLMQTLGPTYRRIAELTSELDSLNESVKESNLKLLQLSMMSEILSRKPQYSVDNPKEQYVMCITYGTEVSSSSGQFTGGYSEQQWSLDQFLYTFEMQDGTIQGCYKQDA